MREDENETRQTNLPLPKLDIYFCLVLLPMDFMFYHFLKIKML